MLRETILLKLIESIVTENIYLKLEPKHISKMKNTKEENELTCDPEDTEETIKHAAKIV